MILKGQAVMLVLGLGP